MSENSSEELPSFDSSSDSNLTANSETDPSAVNAEVTGESGPVPESSQADPDSDNAIDPSEVTKVQIVEPTAPTAPKPETETKDVDFYYPTHTDKNRLLPKTSLYLDDQQRIDAEIQRAKIEGRDPDLENPPAVQGTPLYTAAQISHAGNPVAINVDPSVTLPVVQVKR